MSNFRAQMKKILLPNKTRTVRVIAFLSLLWFFALFFTFVRHGDVLSVAWPMLCGAGGIVFYAMRLYPGFCYLKLTDRGFEYKRYFFLPSRFIEWKEVDHFTTYVHKFRRYVGWTYSERYSGTKIPFPKMFGAEGSFFDNFGHEPFDLVRVLEDWRQNNVSVP